MRARGMVYSLLLLVIFMTAPAPALAANIERGKFLHEQHCTSCHDTREYTRPGRRIESLDALKHQVKHCELGQSLKWPQPDVDDVVAYLDATFYKFGGATGGAQK